MNKNFKKEIKKELKIEKTNIKKKIFFFLSHSSFPISKKGALCGTHGLGLGLFASADPCTAAPC